MRLSFLPRNPPKSASPRAFGESIFTHIDSIDTLRQEVRDAVRCHFDEAEGPSIIRPHYVREEVLAPWRFQGTWMLLNSSRRCSASDIAWVRQSGSHIRLQTDQPRSHALTAFNHSPLKPADVVSHLE